MILFLVAFFSVFPFLCYFFAFSLSVSFVFLYKPYQLPDSQEYQLGWLSSHAFVWFVFWGDIWEVVGFHEETHIQVG